MTAKLRGKKRWNHKGDVWSEAMALEIRSILSVLGHHQKTLKRWTRPAPNQEV